MPASLIDILLDGVVDSLYNACAESNSLHDLSSISRTCRQVHAAVGPWLFKAVVCDLCAVDGSNGVGVWREDVRLAVRSLSITSAQWLRPQDTTNILTSLPLFPRLQSLKLPSLNLLPSTLHPYLGNLKNLTTLHMTVNSNSVSYLLASLLSLRAVTLDISGGRFTSRRDTLMAGFVPFPYPDIYPSLGVTDVVLLSDKQHSYAPFEIDAFFPNVRNVVIYAERGYHGGTMNAYLPILQRLPRLETLSIYDGRRFGHCSCTGANGLEPDLPALIHTAHLLSATTLLQSLSIGCAVDSTVGSGYWEMRRMTISIADYYKPDKEDAGGVYLGGLNVEVETFGWTKDRKFWEKSGMVKI